MSVVINLVGIFVFLGIAYLCSRDRKHIDWKSVGIVVAIQLLLGWFFTSFSAGRTAVLAAADGFKWLVNLSYKGIAFALPNWVSSDLNVGGTLAGNMNFITAALLPILLIVPLFDILTYIGVLPWIIKWLGKGLSLITGQPKFEAFFAVEMMFLGNTEVLAVSKLQLSQMKAERSLTLALMSMSCITASILGAYISMMPGEYVLTAVPLNILGSIAIAAILNPVRVPEEDDTVADLSIEVDDDFHPVLDENGKPKKKKKEAFFSFLGDSILGAGYLVFIITVTVIAFVALAYMIDQVLLLTGYKWLTLENMFGVVMFPFAWLLGLDPSHAFEVARLMGTKLVTNEFVVMGEVSKDILAHKGMWADAHVRCALTVFITSFANFGTLGMIIGAFKGLVDDETNELISRNVPLMLLSGILVSLLSAATAAIFVW